MNDEKYLVLLSSFVPFGATRTNLIVSYFGSSKRAWESKKHELIEIGVKRDMVDEFIKYRDSLDAKDFFKNLVDLDISYITINDLHYPQNLVDLDDAPLVLYYKGKLSKNDINSIAIVGSRRITTYGKEVTRNLSIELARYGVAIISGLAFGVDAMVHKSALEVDGRCIGVLASGLDEITPRSNEWLGKKILKNKGLLVSEYPPNTTPLPYYFPHRNRIISGLSKAVIIIEGRIKSGTIHTAKAAADQGRQVFAVPGQITSPNSEAPHYLIQNGAVMVTSTKDILDELNLQLMVDKEKVSKVLPSDEIEENILTIIAEEPIHLDKIVRISKMDVSTVSARLTIMVIKGLATDLGNKTYKKT